MFILNNNKDSIQMSFTYGDSPVLAEKVVPDEVDMYEVIVPKISCSNRRDAIELQKKLNDFTVEISRKMLNL